MGDLEYDTVLFFKNGEVSYDINKRKREKREGIKKTPNFRELSNITKSNGNCTFSGFHVFALAGEPQIAIYKYRV